MESLQILVSIFGLLFSMVLIGISAGVTVHVHHQDQDVSPESLPDELNATIVDESGTATFLQLQRAKHIVPDVPVYTLNVDNEGKYVTRREILQNTQNVGYYQDVSAEAALQVKRMEASEDKSNHFILRGELTIAGQNYKLDHDPSPGKREAGAAPSSEYRLEPFTAVSASEIDIIDPPQPPVQDVLKLFQPSATGHAPSATSRVQRQTSGPTNIYIDLVAVADYAVYKRFRSESRPKDEDLNSLKEHFYFVVNGIDMRYRSIKSSKYAFHVSLARLIISETAAASSFTENYKKIVGSVEYVNSSPSLAAFSEFTTGAGRDVIFPRDHALLFTGYDLVNFNDKGEISQNIAGMAYGSTACQPDKSDKSSSSIIEDGIDYRSESIASHELGHSLGAQHDGDGNSCLSTNHYTMSTALDIAHPNSFSFSNCSINYFEQYISDQLSNEIGQKCLLEQLPVSPDIPDISNRLFGQEYSPDEQCRRLQGNRSSYCREFATPSEICLSMSCRIPPSTTCSTYQAFHGTTCGNGKMCLNGQCLSDPRAPAGDDDCLFGDNLGVTFNDQTCDQLVNSFTAKCYQSSVRQVCCASCKKASRKLSGCEYGDSVQGCLSFMCNYATPLYLQTCCGTCNYGTPLPESVNTQAAAFVTESQQARTSDSSSPVATLSGFF